MISIPIIPFNGDRYVWSKDLYKALALSPVNYAGNLQKWFGKEYLFQGKLVFSKPVENYDYTLVVPLTRESHTVKSIGEAISQMEYSYRGKSIPSGSPKSGRLADNYMIRLEFAKLIALDSNSKFKKQFVQWLLSLEAQFENNHLLSRTTLFGLMEMVKLCSYIDNQLEYYRGNKNRYFEFKEEDDRWDEFDRWRNSVLGLLTDADLTEEIIKLKGYKPGKGVTKVEKIALLNTLESIRVSLFDFLCQQLNPNGSYDAIRARDLSDFVKKLFETAGIDRIDIKPKGYSPNGQLDLFRQMQDIDVGLISQTLRELQPAL